MIRLVIGNHVHNCKHKKIRIVFCSFHIETNVSCGGIGIIQCEHCQVQVIFLFMLMLIMINLGNVFGAHASTSWINTEGGWIGNGNN